MRLPRVRLTVSRIMLVIAAAALVSLSLAALWAGYRAMGIRAIAETGSHFASMLAIAGGAWWFIYTTRFKPRVQFDVDRSIPLLSAHAATLVVIVSACLSRWFQRPAL